MKTIQRFAPGFVASILVFGAVAAPPEQSVQTEAKKHFAGPVDAETCIKEAAKMNLAVTRFAQLAQEKAENSDLKRFGETLARDHRKAQARLEEIARKHNVTLPTAPDAKCEEEIAKLKDLNGAAFDNEFAKGAVEGHAMAVKHLEKASSQVKDADLRNYTTDMLGTIRTHQRRARDIAKAVGVDEATIAFLENKANEAAGAPGENQSGTSTEDGERGSGKLDSSKPSNDGLKREPKQVP